MAIVQQPGKHSKLRVKLFFNCSQLPQTLKLATIVAVPSFFSMHTKLLPPSSIVCFGGKETSSLRKQTRTTFVV